MDLVWATPAQQRVRTILWIVMHNRLLCNANRMHCHLTNDPSCKICSIDTYILDSLAFSSRLPYNKEYLGKCGRCSQQLTTRHFNFYTGDLLAARVRNLKEEGSNYSVNWATRFALTLWWNWKYSGETIYFYFNRHNKIPIDTGRFLHLHIAGALDALHGST